jgi:hypothetical protein
MITVIESSYRETGIICPKCLGKWMTYSDGESAPQCSNPLCLFVLPAEYVYKWLITLPDFRGQLRVDYANKHFPRTGSADGQP